MKWSRGGWLLILSSEDADIGGYYLALIHSERCRMRDITPNSNNGPSCPTVCNLRGGVMEGQPLSNSSTVFVLHPPLSFRTLQSLCSSSSGMKRCCKWLFITRGESIALASSKPSSPKMSSLNSMNGDLRYRGVSEAPLKSPSCISNHRSSCSHVVPANMPMTSYALWAGFQNFKKKEKKPSVLLTIFTIGKDENDHDIVMTSVMVNKITSKTMIMRPVTLGYVILINLTNCSKKK